MFFHAFSQDDLVVNFEKFGLNDMLRSTVTLRLAVLGLIIAAMRSPKTHSAIAYIVNGFFGLPFMMNGAALIAKEYNKSIDKQCFKVATPSSDHYFVKSDALIEELIKAPVQKLSLYAAGVDILQPAHTIPGYSWDGQGSEGDGFLRALRTRLTINMPHFRSGMERILDVSFQKELPGKTDEYHKVKLYPALKRTVSKMNAAVFFGEALAQNEEFMNALIDYPEDTFKSAELARISPSFLKGLVVRWTTNNYASGKIIKRYLTPLIEERLAMLGVAGAERSVDCVQWFVEAAPRKVPWPASKIVLQTMAIWSVSVHQLAIGAVYAVEDLYRRPEYIEPLLQECQQESLTDSASLPLLESFLKESMRCSSAEGATCRRKAVAPYTFKDGSSVNTGDWVCVPQQALLLDAARYSNPDTFDGFRQARANGCLDNNKGNGKTSASSQQLKIVDTTCDWPIWGLGPQSCPGRFYAIYTLKLIMMRVIEGWEGKLPDSDTLRKFSWRSYILPRDDAETLMRKVKV